jgi:MFS family permease
VKITRLISTLGFSRDAWLLSAAIGVFTGALLGMMQLLKVIFVLRLGYGPEFVGTLFATGALSFTAFSLPGGALGGRLGPRRTMILGAIIMVVGMAMLPVTELTPYAIRPYWLLLVQVVSSAGWSMVIVNHVPAMMVFTTPESRRGAYALREALAGLGTFLGMLVAGLLPGAFAGLLHLTTDHSAPYQYALGVCVVAAMTGLVPLALIGEVQPMAPTRRQRASSPPLMPLAMLVTCAFLNHSAVASCRAFAFAYMDTALRLPTSLVGLMSSLGMLGAILAALGGPRLARRRGSGHAMTVASIGLAFSLLLMGLIRHWAAAGLGMAGMLALSAVWIPAYQVLQMEMAEPEWRPLVAGASSMGMSLGFGTMSLVGGHIVAAFGYNWLFVLGAVLATLSATVMQGTMARREAPRRRVDHA